MRAPLSWLVEVVPGLAGRSAREVADLLVAAGIEVDEVLDAGAGLEPLVVGEVVAIEELTGFKKPIRYCQVRVGADETRGIVCGARNFAVGDRVVVALPGAVLPGDFRIAARKTYGHVSDGMICSVRELGIGDDHDGILVLPGDPKVGTDARRVLGLDDAVLVTEPTPDRGYQLSIRGLGRELAAALDVPYDDPAAIDTPEPTDGGFPVSVEDPVGCTRFTARVLRGFDPAAPTPDWLAARLRQVGMRPISLAVDVTNYLTAYLGQPMHAYDLARLSGGIVVRRAKQGESITTLDDVTRPLSAGEELLVCDHERIHGLAGVMGAEYGEISASTTDLLLEAAHFDPTVTSRTVRRHGLLSEAGRRFERWVDPALGPVAVQLATDLLCRYGGATADPDVTVVGAVPERPAVEIPVARVRAVVGVDYSVDTVAKELEAVGCRVERTGDRLRAVAPSWRPDLVEVVDHAEEVARLDGYDRIPSVLPAAPAGTGLTAVQRCRRSVALALAHAGFVETPSMSFQDVEVLDRLRVPADDERRRLVALANPLTSRQTHLRSSLLPGLLATLGRNLGRGFEDLALSEIGTVFTEPAGGRPPAPAIDVAVHPDADQLAALEAALPVERTHVAVALCGRATPDGWWGAGTPVTWADAVAAVRTAADAAGVPVQVRAAEHAPWHPGRCAEIALSDGTVLGYAGELHPAVCDALELPRRTCAAEVDLGALLAADRPAPPAPLVSPYPPATQDIALVAGSDVPVQALLDALRAGGGDLLEDVRLFDVYTGAQVGDGRTSLAFRLRFRAPDRTLTVAEATAARDAAVAATARLGATLRGA